MGVHKSTSIRNYFYVENLVPLSFCCRRHPFRENGKVISLACLEIYYEEWFCGRHTRIALEQRFFRSIIRWILTESFIVDRFTNHLEFQKLSFLRSVRLAPVEHLWSGKTFSVVFFPAGELFSYLHWLFWSLRYLCRNSIESGTFLSALLITRWSTNSSDEPRSSRTSKTLRGSASCRPRCRSWACGRARG